jgi:hypothetical protein
MVRVGGEGVDVVPNGVAGQLLGPGRSVELCAKEDIFPPGDELLVYLGKLVEGEVPAPFVELRGRNNGGEGDIPGRGASETTRRSTRLR